MNPAGNNPEDAQLANANDCGVSIRLRDISHHDLPRLFEYQLDPESNRMARTHPRNADAFNLHWKNVLADTSVITKAIVAGDVVAGCIACFKSEGQDSIGYWIGREFRGRGIATQALMLMLDQISLRPLYACVAVSNTASLRVMQKCGFQTVGYRQSVADDRYEACKEAILELAGDKHE